IVVAALAVTGAAFVLPLAPDPLAVAAAQAASGAAAAVFPPAIAAVTLGLVGPAGFARRVGRNEAFNHAGNATAAALAGGAAYLFGPIAVFWLMAGMAVASIAAAASIPAAAIDHRIARGLDAPAETGDDAADRPSGWAVLLTCRPLLIFAGCTTAFHLANAAMLPLVGQKLALANQQIGTSLTAACIVAAQVVMVPVAWLVGSKADAWGRKPLFAAGFLVLAARGALYPVSDDPYWLVGVQLLDGIGAGAFGALFPLVVADLTRGTGHFNVSLGAIATAQGIGAALSNAAAGLVVVRAGYDAAFLALAGTAAAGLLIWLVAMPETRAPALEHG
ncbi:MAG: MFS transporter, partial [Alphaproteobacteria bacterium]|nr:MFS transporter [Alphaproteobacteria bacterium]